MSRSVLAVVALASIAASSLSAPVAGYRFALTETTSGLVVEADGPVDATQIVCADVPAGTYQPSIVCVDAAGNALTPAVLATDVLVVNDVATVMVNVPASLAASLV
jgi:hypothetical protein